MSQSEFSSLVIARSAAGVCHLLQLGPPATHTAEEKEWRTKILQDLHLRNWKSKNAPLGSRLVYKVPVTTDSTWRDRHLFAQLIIMVGDSCRD